MRYVISLAVLVVALACPSLASAQQNSITVSFFPAGTTDANAAGTPISTQTYVIATAILCGQTKTPRTTNLVIAPGSARYDDPANPTTADCIIGINSQVTALPNTSTQYVAAIRSIMGGVTSAYGNVSNPFARTAPQSPPTGLGIS